MTKDLPDFQSEIVSAAVEATAFRSGLDADKPASPAAGDIWLARDTDKLYVCLVAGAWTAYKHQLNEVTWSKPTRALDTIYQNTSGKIKYVSVSVLCWLQVAGTEMSGESRVTAQMGASSPPTTEVARVERGPDLNITGTAIMRASSTLNLSFIVPINYYYRLVTYTTIHGQAPSIMDWCEWDLH